MTSQVIERIAFLTVITLVWVAAVTAGFTWLKPGERVVKGRYLTIVGVTAVVLAATVIVGVFGRSLWIAAFGAVGLVLLGLAAYQQLRSVRPGGPESHT